MPNLKYPIIDGKKLCAACKEMKPVAEFRKARKHLSTKCVKCLSVYYSNLRQQEDYKERQREYLKKYKSNPENRKKINKRISQWRKTPKARSNKNKARRGWAAREKAKAVAYKGGACMICGYSACLAALDFHHRDPKEKDGYGTGALKSHWTFEKNKPEVDKCDLVCVRCHREIHAGLHPAYLKGGSS